MGGGLVFLRYYSKSQLIFCSRSQRLTSTSQLPNVGGGATTPGGTIDATEQKLLEKDAELRRMQEMLARMQEQMKQQSTTNLAANY